jgi:hypothetical protein
MNEFFAQTTSYGKFGLDWLPFGKGSAVLTISMTQLDVLAAARRAMATARLAALVSLHFPVQARHAGDAAVHATAELAVERGRAIGCDTERYAGLYLLLICLLGQDFATDPRHPWAAAWLAERPGTTLRYRLERLVDLANEQLDLVHGPDNELLVRSLIRIRRVTPEDFAAAGTGPSACAAWLATLCPGWAAVQGGAVLSAVVAAAPDLAKTLRLDGPGPIATVALHALMLGYGFASDRLYPWASEALSRDAEDRAGLLFAASLDYITAVLA